MRLYIIRHADPDYANDTITPAGHREAAALARRLTAIGLDRIYCSPLGRARATMQYTADLTGIAPVIEPWTAELPWRIMTEASPHATWNIDGHLLRTLPCPEWDHGVQHFPLLERLGRVESDPPQPQAYEALCAASDGFLASLGYEREGVCYRVVRPNTERVAVFCHGGLGLTWLSHLLHVPLAVAWSSFFLWPSSVTTILMDERVPGVATPRCIGLAETAHLYAEGLEPTPAGIVANTD